MNYTKFSILLVPFLLFLISSAYASNNYIEDAKSYLEKGENKAAIIQLKNHIKQYPDDASIRLLLGQTYLKTNQFQLAEKEINKAYNINPQSKQVQLAYAQILLGKRQYKKVSELLKDKYKNKSMESQRLAYMGYAALGQNLIADASYYFKNSNIQQENDLSFNGLAQIALLNKSYNKAEKLLQKSLQLKPSEPVTLALLASVYNLQGRYNEALDIYNQLIKPDSKNIQLYNSRIATYLALNQLNKAQEDLNNAFKIFPDNLQLKYLQAQLSLKAKDYKRAQKAAQKVLSVHDRHLPSQAILGMANFGLQNYNQSEKYLTQYLSAKPEDLKTQNLLANVYLIQKKPEQAILILEGLDENKINRDPNILFTLGSAYLLAGEYEKGIAFLQKAENLKPKNEVIKKRLVEGFLKKGDIQQAISNLEELNRSEKTNKETQQLLIVIYIRQKLLDKAEEKLTALLKQYPDDPQLYNIQAVIERLKGNTQKAVESYNTALSFQKDFVPAYMGLAEIEKQNKNITNAKKYYEQIIAIKKDYTRAYYALAAILEKQGDWKLLEDLMMQAYKNAPDVTVKVKVATILSKIYAKNRQADKTLSLAKDLLRENPENIPALSFYSGALIVNDKTKEAQNILKTIIAKRPDDIKHRILLIQLLTKAGKHQEEILALFDEANKIQPDNQNILLLQTRYLIQYKRYFQAEKNISRLVQQFPDNPEVWLLKGQLNLANKQYKEALKTYQKAYQLKQQNKTLFIIADLMKLQNKGEEGILLLEKELEKNSKNIGVYIKLANIYQQKKQYDKAIEHYKKALALQPENILALNNLADIYTRQHNPEALSLAQRAYKLAPQSAAIIDTYASVLISQGDMASGISLLEEAVEKSPKSYDIIYHLAEAYVKNGEKEKAKIKLKPLLNKDIKFSGKEKARVLYNKL